MSSGNGIQPITPKILRDKLREKILATHQPVKELVTFFGAEIELRQPTLGALLKIRDDNVEDQSRLVNMLLMYAYVPGTNELVFETGDNDSLLALPFGKDFTDVSEAVQRLSNVNFLQPKSVSETTQSDSSSSGSGTN